MPWPTRPTLTLAIENHHLPLTASARVCPLLPKDWLQRDAASLLRAHVGRIEHERHLASQDRAGHRLPVLDDSGDEVRDLLRYGEETAGGIMEAELVAVCIDRDGKPRTMDEEFEQAFF